MADTYLMESLEADPGALRENALNRLRELLPEEYDPDRDPYGALLLQAVAEAQVPLVDVVSDVLATIFAHVAEVAGTERIMPTPAAGLVTVTTDGAETRVLPAGATLRGFLPDGTAVLFATTEDRTIEKGEPYSRDLPVEAVYDGPLVTMARPQALEPDQAYTWLRDVTLTDLTALGTDGEDDDAYMARAASAMRDQADMLILPGNVQRFVQRIPGVGRSLVLDQVDATDPEHPVLSSPRCVTVVVTGPDGSGAGPDLLEDVRKQLQARREVCFRFFVEAATPVVLDIELTVAAWPEAAGPDTREATAERVEEALRAWLHPATFGSRSLGLDDGSWQPTSTLRIGEVVSAADAVSGIDYVDPSLVLINGQNADFPMVAPLAALPDPAGLTVTVNVVQRQP